MKRCPYCAEEIQDAAILCRWCGSRLDRKPRTKGRFPIEIVVVAIIAVVILGIASTSSGFYGATMPTPTVTSTPYKAKTPTEAIGIFGMPFMPPPFEPMRGTTVLAHFGNTTYEFRDGLVEVAEELNVYSSGFFVFYVLLPGTTFEDVVAHYSKEAAADGWVLNKKDNVQLFMEYKKDIRFISLIYWPPETSQAPRLQMHWTGFLQ